MPKSLLKSVMNLVGCGGANRDNNKNGNSFAKEWGKTKPKTGSVTNSNIPLADTVSFIRVDLRNKGFDNKNVDRGTTSSKPETPKTCTPSEENSTRNKIVLTNDNFVNSTDREEGKTDPSNDSNANLSNTKLLAKLAEVPNTERVGKKNLTLEKDNANLVRKNFLNDIAKPSSCGNKSKNEVVASRDDNKNNNNDQNTLSSQNQSSFSSILTTLPISTRNLSGSTNTSSSESTYTEARHQHRHTVGAINSLYDKYRSSNTSRLAGNAIRTHGTSTYSTTVVTCAKTTSVKNLNLRANLDTYEVPKKVNSTGNRSFFSFTRSYSHRGLPARNGDVSIVVT